ncbi:substrate-binding domain-containing protein [Chromobacterium sp. IIBBL 290-4]|uniref:substrate-binding domain-containing protein n=1 Tax=Chromobacterium sp. IIBBL 290-4 TaxID=2953890 RepID=UPI0020B719A6|nr:substrate-binding domain-containing protein [Chromobacterium sp. IIBBL 290-4]UTH76052.1 substrate-binding domain-containing protein [Chromobacterium sp. IIBBL 290-4]
MFSLRLLPILFLFSAAPSWAAPSRIGISVGALDNPFYQALVRGAIQAAHHLNPSAQITSLSANFTLPLQQQQMRQLIAQKVDLILLGAVDSQAIAPEVQRAREAGITVVAVDVDAPGVDGTVKSDNRQAGEITCRYLAEQLGGKGNLLIQGGPPVSSVSDRIAGCRAALAAFPKMHALDGGNGLGSSLGGQRAMQQDLARYPAIDALFATNDRQALGSEKALDAQTHGHLLIGAVDGSPDIERALRRPGRIIASASQSPYLIGREAVLLGQKLQLRQPTERLIKVPVSLVNRYNLAQYQGWLSALPPIPKR